MLYWWCGIYFEVWLSLVERCVRDAEAAGSSPVISTTSSRTLYRSWRLFLLKKPSLTHAVVPPFRNRSRSSRLFGCKRPHDGFVLLPPCFGLLLLVFLNIFLWYLFFAVKLRQDLNLHSPCFAEQNGHIIKEKTDKACLVRSCHLDHVECS